MPIIDFIHGFFLTTELQALIFILLFFPGVVLIEILIIRVKFGPLPRAASRDEAVTIHMQTEQDSWRGRIPFAVFFFILSFTFLIPAWRETSTRLHSFQTIATVTEAKSASPQPLLSGKRKMAIDYSYSVNGSVYTGKASVCYMTGSRRTFSSLRCETYKPRRGDEYPLFVSRTNLAISQLPKPFIFNWFSGFVLLGLAAFFFFDRSTRASKGNVAR